MNLDGVPDSIPIAKVQELIAEVLGIQLDQLTQDGVNLGWYSIKCTVYALDATGSRYVDMTTGEAAVHHINVPVDLSGPFYSPAD